MAEMVYEIERPWGRRRDGLQVWTTKLVILERLGGEQTIPLNAVTSIELDPGILDRTIRIHTAGHTYVLRREPSAKAKAAVEAIHRLLDERQEGNTHGD
jgi:hypothetical protein